MKNIELIESLMQLPAGATVSAEIINSDNLIIFDTIGYNNKTNEITLWHKECPWDK